VSPEQIIIDHEATISAGNGDFVGIEVDGDRSCSVAIGSRLAAIRVTRHFSGSIDRMPELVWPRTGTCLPAEDFESCLRLSSLVTMGHIPRERGKISGDITDIDTDDNRCAPIEQAKSGQVVRADQGVRRKEPSLRAKFQNEVFSLQILTRAEDSEIEVDRDVFRLCLCQLMKLLKGVGPACLACRI
jgi:hypothetical protein